MTITNVSDIYDTATYILEEIIGIYDEYFDEVAELPGKRYIAAGGGGTQPHDEEQVTVSFDQAYVGSPGEPVQTPSPYCDEILSGVYIVEIARMTIPPVRTVRGTGIPPRRTMEQENDLAKVQMQDARLLMEVGRRVASKYSAVGSVSDVSAGPEQGGYQAMVLTLILPV